jgi:MFS family permease
LRFLFIACIQNAWHILPFEMLQGITHAAVWATLCSLLEDAAAEESSEETQAWLHASYSALGKGLGSIVGGLLIRWLGTRSVFGMYALASLLVLLILFLITLKYPELDSTGVQSTGADPKTNSAATQSATGSSLSTGTRTVETGSWEVGNQVGFKANNCLNPPVAPSFCGLTPHGVPTAPIGSVLTEPPNSPQRIPSNLPFEQHTLFAQNDPLADQLISGTLRDWKPEVRTYRQTLQKQLN